MRQHNDTSPDRLAEREASPPVTRIAGFWFALAVHSTTSLAQSGPDLTRERADFTQWLATAPTSPLAAVAQQVIGAGLTLGPAQSDIPLKGVAASRVAEEQGVAFLYREERRQALARGQIVVLGEYRIVANGFPGRSVLAVYGPQRAAKTPSFFAPDPRFALSGTLTPPAERASHRILSPDGVETNAVEAGTFTVSLESTATALRVYRVQDPGTEESQLLVYFRDSTSGAGTYPAGRFVELTPLSGNRYLLDFNRASNPFCAYSSVYACPVPWPGNTLSVAVTAGERYQD